ncbi:hypothetical protein AB1Y20_014461 [Prymnesium parvum]|uniref:Uncharacterized protein n=1 Tax=Prymnesium parvum TaxID=97485 RepID=A0AB34IH44_PRYPA
MAQQLQLWHSPAPALAFMYAPVVSTVSAALSGTPLTLVHRAARPHTARGARGDWFVFIGPELVDKVPWARLRAQGVHTVWYSTEPFDGCSSVASDEVWSYTWRTVERCRGSLQMYRYVPPGALRVAGAEVAAAAGGDTPVVLFGFPHFKSGRGACYAFLERSLGARRLSATFSVWNNSALLLWWEEVGRRATHLTLHKHCRLDGHSSTQPLESFRLSILLSLGATVISEHSYPRDEQEYAGLVTFGTLQEIPRLLNEPKAPRSAVDIARRFRRRFSPTAILERAGVYDSLRRTRAAAQPPPEPLLPAHGAAAQGSVRPLRAEPRDAPPRRDAPPAASRYALLVHGRMGSLHAGPSMSLAQHSEAHPQASPPPLSRVRSSLAA